MDSCLAKCASGGYAYAGMEYGSECYCSNTLRTNALQAPENECSMPCPGNCKLCFLFGIIFGLLITLLQLVRNAVVRGVPVFIWQASQFGTLMAALLRGRLVRVELLLGQVSGNLV